MHLERRNGVSVGQQDRDKMANAALASVRGGEDYCIHTTGEAVVMAYRCDGEIVVVDADLRREGREEE